MSECRHSHEVNISLVYVSTKQTHTVGFVEFKQCTAKALKGERSAFINFSIMLTYKLLPTS